MSICKLMEKIDSNTEAIKQLNMSILGLVEAMYDNNGDDSDNKEPETYLNGTPIAK